MAIFAAAGWLALASAWSGGALTIPGARALFIAAPVAVAGLMLATRRAYPGELWGLVGFAVATGVALVIVPIALDRPEEALAVPLFFLAAAAAVRAPAAATVTAFAITGTTGVIISYVGGDPLLLIDFTLGALIAGTIWRAVTQGRSRQLSITVGMLLLGLWIAITGVQALLSSDLGPAARAFHTSAYFALPVPLIALAGWRRETYVRIARGFLVVALFVGGYSVIQFLLGPTETERESAVKLAAINVLPGGELALFGPTASRHQLAAWCGVVFPMAAAFLLGWKGRWRLASLIALAGCGVAIVASQTRIGFVGAVAGTLLVLFLYAWSRAFPGLRLGTVAAVMTLVAAAGALGFALAAEEYEGTSSRFGAVSRPIQDPAFRARLGTWQDTIDAIEERPLGYGLGTTGALGQASRGGRVSGSLIQGANAIDNSYLKVAFEQGIVPMLILLAAMIALGFELCRQGVRSTDPFAAAIAIGGAGAFVALTANLFVTDNIENYSSLAGWALAGLGLARFGPRP